LYRASHSGYAEPATRVLTSAAAWAAVWRTLHHALEAGAPPAVDFARQVVALLATGERPTGGYAVRVDGTSAAPGGGLAVHVTRTAPGAGCMTAHVVTAPAEAVRLPWPTAGGRVTFAVRDVSAPC
jgi:hypothetical protein